VTHEQAQQFANVWLAAWNAHDVEGVLAHFSDEVTFTSPVASQIVDGSDGVIRGKEALRAYWREGLKRYPDLRFELVGIYVGIDTVVLNYRNQNGALVSEVLRFDGALVIEGHGAYLAGSTGRDGG
jgi:hypothetical protein